jgi:ornithine--oxo-acid transaminase
VIEEEGLVERSRVLGAHLKARLEGIRSNAVAAVRGRGLWVGVEIDPRAGSARAACERLMEAGILTKDTHGTVLRFAPPLTITREELDWGVDRVERVLHRL